MSVWHFDLNRAWIMGLAGIIQIVGQQPKELAEGGLINLEACRHALTLPTGCSWIQEHLEHPPPITGPPFLWSSGLAWSGAFYCQGRWYIWGYRLGMRCAWAVMWVMEAHRHALACTGHAGHIYLVRECNVRFTVVHFGWHYGAAHDEVFGDW